MKSGMICGLVFASVFGGGCSLIPGSGRSIVTDVNANRLLSTVGEQLDAHVVMQVSRNRDLPVDEDTAPEETMAITRDQDLETRGRFYRLASKDKWSGRVQLGVFADRKAARAIFQAHLFRTSMGPDKDLTREFGAKAVAWSFRQQGQHLRRILFVRDNAVVSIDVSTSRSEEDDGSTGILIALAHAIDNALASGTLGVRRGRTLKVPRIVAVEPLDVVPPAGTARVHISVPENPQDRHSKYVEIV